MSRRLRGIGLLAGLAYLVTVGATLGIGHTSVRPLFDGFTPAPKYRWLAPPDAFVAGNQRPASLHFVIPLDPSGSRRKGAGTSDGQLVLALGPGAIAPHGNDRSVRADVEPVDGARLRPLPAPLRANGNAYRVRLTYAPSGVRVGRLLHAGTLTLAVPELSRDIFRATSTGWTTVPSQGIPPSLTTLTAPFDRAGTYLSATDLPLPPGPDSETTSHTTLIAAGTGILALALIVGATFVARRRRTRDA